MSDTKRQFWNTFISKQVQDLQSSIWVAEVDYPSNFTYPAAKDDNFYASKLVTPILGASSIKWKGRSGWLVHFPRTSSYRVVYVWGRMIALSHNITSPSIIEKGLMEDAETLILTLSKKWPASLWDQHDILWAPFLVKRGREHRKVTKKDLRQ